MLKSYIRTVQTYFPKLVDIKFDVVRHINRIAKHPSEPTYRLFSWFPFSADGEFLDVGGNRGQTIDSFRLYHKTRRVRSFEPNPILFRRLQQRYQGDVNVFVNGFGLGEIDGSFELHVPYYRGYCFDGLASFDAHEAASWLSPKTIVGFDKRHLSVVSETCRVRRWDDVEAKPDLVKIDVQGFETQVLRGGAATIERFRPVFVIENDDRMQHADYLSTLDYRMVGYENGRLSEGRVSHRNTLYVPTEKLEALYNAHP